MRVLWLTVLALVLIPRAAAPNLAPTPEQIRAWAAFERQDPGAFEIRWDPATGMPERIRRRGRARPTRGRRIPVAMAATRAVRFMEENSALFGMRPGVDDCTVQEIQPGRPGGDVWIRQTYRGAAVVGGRYRLRLDREGNVVELRGAWVRDVGRTRCDWISPDDAERLALDALPDFTSRGHWVTHVARKPFGRGSGRAYYTVLDYFGGSCWAWIDPCSGRVIEKGQKLHTMSAPR